VLVWLVSWFLSWILICLIHAFSPCSLFKCSSVLVSSRFIALALTLPLGVFIFACLCPSIFSCPHSSILLSLLSCLLFHSCFVFLVSRFWCLCSLIFCRLTLIALLHLSYCMALLVFHHFPALASFISL
ncbi:hypothetical protein C8J56DRAFT_953002, partial [Mycena floridula]